jgi:hypothetical protein
MNRALRLLGGALVVAALTWWLGWWTVPLVAALWGLRGKPMEVAQAALLAWAGILAAQSIRAPLLPLADRVGGIFGLPAWGLLAVTPLFAALVAWAAATITQRIAAPRPTQGA